GEGRARLDDDYVPGQRLIERGLKIASSIDINGSPGWRNVSRVQVNTWRLRIARRQGLQGRTGEHFQRLWRKVRLGILAQAADRRINRGYLRMSLRYIIAFINNT